MKISNRSARGASFLCDGHIKIHVLGIADGKNVNRLGVRSKVSSGNVIINIMSLYLSGDYLKGGRM